MSMILSPVRASSAATGPISPVALIIRRAVPFAGMEAMMSGRMSAKTKVAFDEAPHGMSRLSTRC